MQTYKLKLKYFEITRFSFSYYSNILFDSQSLSQIVISFFLYSHSRYENIL